VGAGVVAWVGGWVAGGVGAGVVAASGQHTPMYLPWMMQRWVMKVKKLEKAGWRQWWRWRHDPCPFPGARQLTYYYPPDQRKTPEKQKRSGQKIWKVKTQAKLFPRPRQSPFCEKHPENKRVLVRKS